MDVLRKELESIYASQCLDVEYLPEERLEEVRTLASAIVRVNNACAVVTDASCDRCYVYSGTFGELMGFCGKGERCVEVASSDEDQIYTRIHPEDLVEKRMLEYEFFKMVDTLETDVKMDYKATCRIRIMGTDGEYRNVDNSTQVIGLSPAGKIWLILCCYDLSPIQTDEDGINSRIISNRTGEIMPLSFVARRGRVLTAREKEILHLIEEGMPSKQIADELGISVHTVNRHRQNIIEKLSVGNSIEAITAAKAMRLL